MKKSILLFGIVALVLSTACSKINEKENLTANQTITCVAPNDGTKSYVDGLNVKWQEGDEVIVIENGYTTDAGNAYYKLSSGENTTSAKFTKSSGRDITDGTSVTAFSFLKYYWVGGKYYYDIPNNPELVAYSASNDSPVQQYVPMIAKNVTMGEPFVFEHLASAIRLRITNSYSTPITITGITMSSNESTLSGRRELNPADWSEKTYSAYIYGITSTGNVTLAAGETKIVDFIVSKEPQTSLKVEIRTDGDIKYLYKKATFTPKIGTIHSFATTLDDAHKSSYGYTISIDGGASVPYEIGLAFPSTPTSSVALNSNPGIKMDKSELITLVNSLKALSTKSIDLDLKGVTYCTTEFPSGVVGGLGTKLNHLYLPLNITTLPQYGAIVRGCTNAKLHIHSGITKIGWIQWGGTLQKSEALNDGAGFFVDDDNPNYSSKNGVLYSKDGKTLVERIPAKADSVGTVIIPEGVTTLASYALSNHPFVTSYTFPSTITTFNSDVFYSTASLVELIFKSPTPPTLGCALNDNTGYIIIDTGNEEQDNASLALYQTAWAGKLKNWTIKTKGGIMASPSAAISDLSSNDEYSSDLW